MTVIRPTRTTSMAMTMVSPANGAPDRCLRRFTAVFPTTAKTGEIIVYDTLAHHLHRLNQTTTAVWRACSGQRSVPEVAATIEEALRVPRSADTVRLALTRLEDAQLLAIPWSLPCGFWGRPGGGSCGERRSPCRRGDPRGVGRSVIAPTRWTCLGPTRPGTGHAYRRM